MVCNKVLLHLHICFSVILLFSSCQMCEDPCLASVFHILFRFWCHISYYHTDWTAAEMVFRCAV